MANRRANNGPELNTILLGVLGAIASGIGVVGFVVFVGGVVDLARDRGVGLSAPFVVPHVPRTQLLASGADQMFTPFTIVLLAVLIAAGYVALVRWKESLAWLRWPLLLLVFVVAILVFRNEAGNPNPFFRAGDRSVAFGAAILVLIAGGLVIEVLASALDSRTTKEMTNPRVVGLLVAVALTTLLFASLETFAHNEWRPQVRPIALIGKGYPAGLAGIYAGEDDNRIYVGIVFQKLGNNTSNRINARVIEVDRSDVKAFEIGALFAATKDRIPHLIDGENSLLAEVRQLQAQQPAGG